MRLIYFVIACTAIAARLASAQTPDTGLLTGTVRSAAGEPVPGVTATATSPALLGGRTSTTDVNGVYVFRGLPPGAYRVEFAAAGLASERREVAVRAAHAVRLDLTMAVTPVAESVTVVAAAPAAPGTAGISATAGKVLVDQLPMSRRPIDIAELAPGLTTNTFQVGQAAIGGAFGYDNLFLVNGVDVNDNIFGTANTLFIEEAIEETSVLLHGAPASFGRFSGGVINVVTKSGGNRFSGSIRENLSNPAWVRETPRQQAANLQNRSVLGYTHEATFGGPLRRDQLWFFTAGRFERTETANTFPQTGGPFTRTDRNRRGELKVTGRARTADTFQVSFIGDGTEQANTAAVGAARLLDAGALITRRLPNRLFVAGYSAPLSSRVFANVQWSMKRQRFENNGGTGTALSDSPFQTLGVTVPGGFFYHAPYLDATDPESRNNRQLTGSVSALLPTSRAGSHDVRAGGEYFVATGIGGNSQSPTGRVYVTDYLLQGGRPVLDANGRVIPVFTPGLSQSWTYTATRGASLDIRTGSLYAQDRWIVTPRLTVDAGARVEFVRGATSTDLVTVDTTTVLPRLGAAFDLTGDGDTVLDATFGDYAGKYTQVQFSQNTPVGRPSEVDYVYSGPAGQGVDFAPGLDPANYTQVVFANFPTANVSMAKDLRSPLVREFTIGGSRQIWRSLRLRANYVQRSTSHFIDDFVSLANGVTTIPLVGTVTNRVIGNTDAPSREYRAVILQGQGRIGSRATIAGHYTVQIRNHGSFAGEAAGVPGAPSPFGDFPEIFGPALDRLAPYGRLDQFQRHKLRIWGVWTAALGRAGALEVAPLWRVNSGTAYSLTANIAVPAAQRERNPGYPANDINPGVRQLVFFGERGAETFKGYGLVDLATTWTVPVWRSARPWIKVEVYNLLNNQKLIAWDRTVSSDPASALDANGIRTGFVRGPRFGQGTADTHYPQPYAGQSGGRAFRMAFGVRF